MEDFPMLNLFLRFQAMNKLIMCPRCSSVIETSMWCVVQTKRQKPVIIGKVVKNPANSFTSSVSGSCTPRPNAAKGIVEIKGTGWGKESSTTQHRAQAQTAEKDVEPETVIDDVLVEDNAKGQSYENVVYVDANQVTISQPKVPCETKENGEISEIQHIPPRDSLQGTASV